MRLVWHILFSLYQKETVARAIDPMTGLHKPQGHVLELHSIAKYTSEKGAYQIWIPCTAEIPVMEVQQ